MAENKTAFDWSAVRGRLDRLQEVIDSQNMVLNVDDILKKRSKLYQQREQNLTEEQREMVVFRRCSTIYAIAIESLSEIRQIEKLTVIPNISSVIKGVINVRGRIVTVHDLVSFSKGVQETQKESWALIGYGESSNVAILADYVEGIQFFSKEDIRPAPIDMGERKDCFTGMSPQGIIFVNMEGLIQNSDFFYA